jgi:hypothetical protein
VTQSGYPTFLSDVSAASRSLGTSPQRFDAVESPARDDHAAKRSADDPARTTRRWPTISSNRFRSWWPWPNRKPTSCHHDALCLDRGGRDFVQAIAGRLGTPGADPAVTLPASSSLFMRDGRSGPPAADDFCRRPNVTAIQHPVNLYATRLYGKIRASWMKSNSTGHARSGGRLAWTWLGLRRPVLGVVGVADGIPARRRDAPRLVVGGVRWAGRAGEGSVDVVHGLAVIGCTKSNADRPSGHRRARRQRPDRLQQLLVPLRHHVVAAGTSTGRR